MVKDACASLPMVRCGYAPRLGRGIMRPPELVVEPLSGSKSRGGSAMPVYEYYCDKCQREVTHTLSISEHEKGKIKCPKCGDKALRALVSTFFSQTSRKS